MLTICSTHSIKRWRAAFYGSFVLLPWLVGCPSGAGDSSSLLAKPKISFPSLITPHKLVSSGQSPWSEPSDQAVVVRSASSDTFPERGKNAVRSPPTDTNSQPLRIKVFGGRGQTLSLGFDPLFWGPASDLVYP